jgi:hypothetical protein
MFIFRDLFPVVFDEDDGTGSGGEPTGGEPSEPTGGEPAGGQDKFDREYVEKLRRENAAARKRAQEAEAKAKEYEDSQKSEKDKLNESLTTAQERATYADKLDVALDKAPDGMSPAQVRKLAKRLSGKTREELEADADELFADFKPEDGGGPEPRRRPTERLRPGAAPSSEPEETDPDKLAAKVPREF